MSLDVASDLSERAQYTPLPTAKRIFVFIPSGRVWGHYQTTVELEAEWTRWGGSAEFVYEPERAVDCGICAFERGSLGANNEMAQRVKPFFDRHGSEANVFEYDSRAKSFVRINPDWLANYYPPLADKSWDAFPL